MTDKRTEFVRGVVDRLIELDIIEGIDTDDYTIEWDDEPTAILGAQRVSKGARRGH